MTTTTTTSQPVENPRILTADLIANRTQITLKIQEQELILKNNANIGMTEPLIDNEGFPRADIDVLSVRAARIKLIGN